MWHKKKFVQRGSPKKKIPAQAVSEKKKLRASGKSPPPSHHFSNSPSLTCIPPMVSAIMSYSSLTSWRIFVSRQHSTESDYDQSNTWRAVFSSSAKQCLLSVNLKPFLKQTEQQTQARWIVNPRRGKFDIEKSSGARTPTSNSTAQATKMETAATNSGADGTSLNEFRMLKYLKSKWKRFWIISLNIWANIAVTNEYEWVKWVNESMSQSYLYFNSDFRVAFLLESKKKK